jgi:hypothetical protein
LRASKGVGVTIEFYGKMLNVCGIVADILKMAIGRNSSMSGINSGHYYLPIYQIVKISENVEFLPPIRGGGYNRILWES